MMDKKRFKKRFADHACRRYQEKMLKLSGLESAIQKQIMEFTAETGVRILDVQLYDPRTGDIQFEIDI